jgi:DNA-binding NtrC family response regulator
VPPSSRKRLSPHIVKLICTGSDWVFPAKTNSPEEESPPPEPIPTLRLLYSREEGVLLRPPLLLAAGETRLGRAVGTGGVNLVDDGQASRVHAALAVRAGALPRLRDLQSSNGTFVNGERIGEAELRDGDILRIGNTLLILRYEPPGLADAPLKSLLGVSPQARRLRRELQLVGPSATTVLLLGESGVGKEVAARALHELSGCKGSLVAVNCAAITESLAESQLFGHLAGAFTGAKAQPGWFRAAHNGTLFLDELGELPLGLQPKLLRALEDGAITPVGATTPVPCKVRLIAATNRDLLSGINSGRVRGDLYARLAEIVLFLPPLRERREDILLMVQHALGAPAPQLSPRLAEALLLHPWPFNVRELFKVAAELRVRGADAKVLGLELIEARLRVLAVALGPAETKPEASAASPAARPPTTGPVPTVPGESATAQADRPPTRDELAALLSLHGGRVAGVARALCRSRAQIYRWMEQAALDPSSFRR